jgi:hypothetical protein
MLRRQRQGVPSRQGVIVRGGREVRRPRGEDLRHEPVVALTQHMLRSPSVSANIEVKPRVFGSYVGGLDTYVEACESVAAQDYAGFLVG